MPIVRRYSMVGIGANARIETIESASIKRVKKRMPKYEKLAKSKVINEEFTAAEIIDALWAGKEIMPKKVMKAMMEYASSFGDDRIKPNESVLACGLRNMCKGKEQTIPEWARKSRSWKPI